MSEVPLYSIRALPRELGAVHRGYAGCSIEYGEPTPCLGMARSDTNNPVLTN